MTKPAHGSTVTPLDQARELRLAGDVEGALRIGIALIDAQPADVGAASLLCRALVDRGRKLTASEATARLVDAYVRRGDLAAATAELTTAADAEEDVEALRTKIAAAFAHGSDRVADVPPAPPPLPSPIQVSKALEKLGGDALLDRAEAALEAFLATDDPISPTSKIPAFPLFGALDRAGLERLLGAFEVREVRGGVRVVTQGEEGREAYVVVRGFLHVSRAYQGTDTQLAALGPGAIFGEMALVSDAPRAASVTATEASTLLVASRDDLERLAQKHPAIATELGAFCRGRMVANLIRTSSLLRAVDPGARLELIRRFETRTFAQGELLVRQGDEPKGLFLIASGGVEVLQRESDGEAFRVAELGPGDVVGEMSIVLRRPAVADVRAVHATIALELSRDAFQSAIRAYPSLLSEIYALASKRDDEIRSVVAQEALDVDDGVLI